MILGVSLVKGDIKVAIGAIAVDRPWASSGGVRYMAPLPSEWQNWLDAGWRWVDHRIPPTGWADWYAHGDQLH